MENKDGREKMILPFTAIPNILIRERYLSTTEKLVLAQIASMGTTGLTMSLKTLRQQLAPMGNTGLLRAIKRLQFLGLIAIEVVAKKNNEPKFKKPCHRYFFVKDPTEWVHTIDLRTKIKIEAERLNPNVKLNYKQEPFLDEKALSDAFEKWLTSTKATAFYKKPQTSAVIPSTEALKWISKLAKLNAGSMNFLEVASEANYYASYLEDQENEKNICRERLVFINSIFDAFDNFKQSFDEEIGKDLVWIAELESKGLSPIEISNQIAKENNRRKATANNAL